MLLRLHSFFEHQLEYTFGFAFNLINAPLCTGGGLLVYLAISYAYYTIAKRRGIRHPGIAWVPVARAWILGSISDQYQYVSQRKVKNRRKSLLTLNIIRACFGAFWMALAFVASMAELALGDIRLQNAFLLFWIVLIIPGAIFSAVTIALTVIQFMALYDVYRSCQPDNAVVLLILSILINVSVPVILMLLCNKDLGMPPRKENAQPSFDSSGWQSYDRNSTNRGPEL